MARLALVLVAALVAAASAADPTIWDVNARVSTIEAENSLLEARFQAMEAKFARIAELRERIDSAPSALAARLLGMFESGLNTVAASMSTATATYAQNSADRTATLDPMANDLTRMVSDVSGKLGRLRTETTADLSSARSSVAFSLAGTITSFRSDATAQVNAATAALTGAVSTATATAGANAASVTTLLSTLNTYRNNTNTIISTIGPTALINKNIPMGRWNVWNSYSQAFGWSFGNDGAMLGGPAASQWGDDSGTGYAWEISPDKNVQRTLFNKRITSGWNMNVWTNEWAMHSSTNSRSIGILFRIRNTMASTAIPWTTRWYFSCYQGWGEDASATLNGLTSGQRWNHGGNCMYCTVGYTWTIPANRVSTLVFISSSSSWSSSCCDVGVRSLFLAFYGNSLQLPVGLEYVDDLDTATGDYNS